LKASATEFWNAIAYVRAVGQGRRHAGSMYTIENPGSTMLTG
jgi:hypothetical protein